MIENAKFVKYEVIGDTKDEAMASVENLTLMVDATAKYKKVFGEKLPTEDSVNDFLKEYLEKKNYNKPGIGAYIVLQSAVTDKRLRPYTVENIKHESKKHTPEHFYVGRNAETGEELFLEKKKSDAIAKGKEWTTDFKESVKVVHETRLKEKNDLCAIIHYTPSAGTRPCKLLVFGYVND